MDHSLKYLIEALSNYEDEVDSQQIIQKIEVKKYETETEFVDDLDEDEVAYLDPLLEREINYAKSVQDQVRVKELNDVYELLF